ncbi:biotin transporter BioY [Bacillus suaedaesalsae]|uniref:Biotin transporter n=1 Tax=Bacillus suaedaesalsae TaxID=2810349 RepID=A0ABS2DG77_9BACI|nr:biotin transporter BioY [Bacillus suaedaesalsae]MBM6617416.1 biotin transporter BioY [Bacillus suaedaesalsae]
MKTKNKFRTVDLTFVSLFVALMAIGANITSWAPFLRIGDVPITLQTFFCVLAGAVLGSRLGALSMIVYTLLGLVGAPVFAQFSGGPAVIFSPTFGFILSFTLAAFVTGKIIEKSQTVRTFIIASIAGLLVNYVVGTNIMYMAYKLWAAAPEGFTYKMAWLWMVPPFPKDLVLVLFAATLAMRLRRTLSKSSSQYKIAS